MNFFMEIAKLRAARLLWSRIMKEFHPKARLADAAHIAGASGVSLREQDL